MGSICCSKQKIPISLTPGKLLAVSDISKATKLDSNIQPDILNYFKFTRVCGYGQFGIVREAVRLASCKGTTTSSALSSKYAIKSIAKEKLMNKIYMLKHEIEALRNVDHPNIVRLYEIFEDSKYIHFVMDLCTGGDLMDYLLMNGPLSEKQAAEYMKKLLSAVNHLHRLKFCHRDLKPENFLLSTKKSDAEIKIVDFGMAAKFMDNDIQSYVGTPYYFAPEVIKGNYGKECDVWAMGVTLYLILSGSQPFASKSMASLIEQILGCKYDFKDEQAWSNISDEAKDLISRMLVVKPSKRIKIVDALKHPWFQSTCNSQRVQISRNIVDNLLKVKASSKLRQEFLKVVVRNLSEKEIQDLTNLFNHFDTDNSGFINAEAIVEALNTSGLQIASSEMRKIMQKINYLNFGTIRYTDFLALVMDTKEVAQEQLLWAAFMQFDHDNDGLISLEDLQFAIEKAGGCIQEQDLVEIIKEFSLHSNDNMSFDQFKAIMVCFSETNTPDASYEIDRSSTKRLSIKRVAQRRLSRFFRRNNAYKTQMDPIQYDREDFQSGNNLQPPYMRRHTLIELNQGDSCYSSIVNSNEFN